MVIYNIEEMLPGGVSLNVPHVSSSLLRAVRWVAENGQSSICDGGFAMVVAQEVDGDAVGRPIYLTRSGEMMAEQPCL